MEEKNNPVKIKVKHNEHKELTIPLKVTPPALNPQISTEPKVEQKPSGKPPKHEDIHQHVRPDIHHKEVPKHVYHPGQQAKKDQAELQPLKSRFRLDWLWTKVKIGKYHPFPVVVIILMALSILPMVLLTIGIPLGFSFVNIPGMHPIFDFLGIHSDKDLLVVSTWVFWWPIFIASILLVKRLWCGGFCPFGFMTDIGNFFGKKLRKGEQPKPINIVKYIFIGFLVFKALGYLHDAIGITNSAVLTVEFLVFFVVYAIIIGMIAPRRTFCRLFCFLGALPHLFGRLSIYTLETDRSKCVKCKGQWCVTGHKSPPHGISSDRGPLLNIDGCPMFINVPQLSHNESNRNCILCGNCIKNCPYDAIHYKPKVPGYELYKGIDLNFHETVFVLGFIPLLAMFTAMEAGFAGQFATMFRFGINYHWAITGVFYLMAIIVFVFFYYLVSGIGAMILGVDYKLALRNFGYIFLPFCYLAMIRDITLTYFFQGSFLPVQFPDFPVVYPFFDMFLVLTGTVWSIYMAKKISEVTLKQGNQQPNDSKVMVNTLLHVLFIAALAWYWISLMFPTYLVLLAEYNLWYTSPFIVSGILIGGFVLIARYYSSLKKILANPMGAKSP